MPGGGRLTFVLGTEAGAVTVAVRDTGAGMARETGQRVFEPAAARRPVGAGAAARVYRVGDALAAGDGA
jgi:C4-dicarboxylate-specific signal transduction histidine kinase